ncbi:MAG: DUF1489 family protein, partial [Pseudomonadota bacterium]
GAEGVDDIAAWQARLMRTLPAPVHHTRMMPKRVDELLDGGSIYWVRRRAIRVRQRIIDVREIRDDAGRLCELVFDPELVETDLQPKKPFQGWRYLKAEDAPDDLIHGAGAAGLPPALSQELKTAMVW